MERARTRGQPAALAAVRAMVRGRLPHALLLSGPTGIGKTTLALDVAATVLCQAPDRVDRPCRVCRACRMVDAGNHPDLHRLAPSGPGAQIGIGGPDRLRGVRDLISELALLPVEAGLRVAIIEAAHRLNEDAQSALLKTLEEPPAATLLLLCADEEERLLPTVRSRCARVRLGPVGVRVIESLLAEQGVAVPPRAARLARLAAGRPGLAIAYARALDAEVARMEIARQLLDLLDATAAGALGAVRQLLGRSVDLVRALEAGSSEPSPGLPGATGSSPGAGGASGANGGSGAESRSGAGRGRRRPAVTAARDGGPHAVMAESSDGGNGDKGPADLTGSRLSAQDRRRAAMALIGIWQDVARDLAVAGLGDLDRVRDVDLLDELEAAAARLAAWRPSHPAAFLGRLARATELIEGNASPELVLDVLVLGWRIQPAAAHAAGA